MLFIYRLTINFIFLISPIIIIYRIIKKKEHPKRFLEKFSIASNKRGNGNIIWFHGSSVGEILSIIPLIEKFENRKDINKILITSNTLSSSKIIEKLKLKKVTHQFFPIDTNFFLSRSISRARFPILCAPRPSFLYTQFSINLSRAFLSLVVKILWLDVETILKISFISLTEIGA